MRKDDLDVGFIPMAPASPALPSSLGTSGMPASLRRSPYREVYKAAQPVAPEESKASSDANPQPSNSSPLDSSLGISYPNPANVAQSSAPTTSPLGFPIGALPTGRAPVRPAPFSGGRVAMS